MLVETCIRQRAQQEAIRVIQVQLQAQFVHWNFYNDDVQRRKTKYPQSCFQASAQVLGLKVSKLKPPFICKLSVIHLDMNERQQTCNPLSRVKWQFIHVFWGSDIFYASADRKVNTMWFVWWQHRILLRTGSYESGIMETRSKSLPWRA